MWCEKRNDITLGLWAVGNSAGFHAPIDARSAKNLIKTAYKKGIHSFDSAFSYGSDSLLYAALRELGVRSDEVEIFEKIMPFRSLRRKAEASLRALKRDCIDALIIHWPREEELFLALREAEKLMDEKKFNAIGISNFPPELAISIAKDFPISYNEYFSSPTMIQSPIEGMRNLKYGIYSFGSLLMDEKPDGERGKLYYYGKDAYPHFIALRRELEKIAEEKGVSEKDLLFSFAIYDRPYRVIIGARREDQADAPKTAYLDSESYERIAQKGKELQSFLKSDNIFSHDWRKG